MKIKEKDFDIKKYLQTLGRRKILLLFPLVILLSSGVFASFKIKPTYLSSTILLMRETRLLSRSIENIVPGMEPAELSWQERAQRQASIETFGNRITIKTAAAASAAG